ncbi:hypothetical protein MICAG_3590003 [Microcystis aeruginosa PCC 9808]|uniref:Uncharacterized protein n=1 Tax=Microcystis aeruginosa PCC 9808 TaxID=1160284 RepID=I4HZY6_MICAE|nr:hypothetical protein MICAG_3590003 [Microcystis aeruginosa PCC 9808]
MRGVRDERLGLEGQDEKKHGVSVPLRGVRDERNCPLSRSA